jgi:hypothetical protein
MTQLLRSLIHETLLYEDEKNRQEIASIAKKISGGLSSSKIREMGRVLKSMWRAEADIQSFKKVTFIHWQDIRFMSTLVSYPIRKNEISTIPYVKPPWTQLKGLNKISERAIGAIIEGWPTLIANADLNSHAFRDGKVPFYEIPEEKQEQRRKSSGWNKYPGYKSIGSEDLGARSWEDFLVFTADEIMPHEKITFDVAGGVKHSYILGWPEALIDNWKITGLVIPDSVIQHYGIDEIHHILQRHEFPDDMPIYDENGNIRSYTK